ncbi:MAG: endonuclease V [bacterium]
MIACIDVYYRLQSATVACILFQSWTHEYIIKQIMEQVKDVKPYESGNFYKRELPCILAVISKIKEQLECIVIDGYVWLENKQTPGLGAYLYKNLQSSIPVIGVAKSKYKRSISAQIIFRGGSKRPLYITAEGIDEKIAAGYIRKMQGPYRIPNLIKQVDRLCRCGISV